MIILSTHLYTSVERHAWFHLYGTSRECLLSQMEKVLRGIQGEKSSKDMVSYRLTLGLVFQGQTALRECWQNFVKNAEGPCKGSYLNRIQVFILSVVWQSCRHLVASWGLRLYFVWSLILCFFLQIMTIPWSDEVARWSWEGNTASLGLRKVIVYPPCDTLWQ